MAATGGTNSMNTLRTLTHMKKAIFTAIAVASLAILPATAQAVPIVGTLDLTGAVRVTADLDRLAAAETLGSGSHASEPTSTGYFDPLANTLRCVGTGPCWRPGRCHGAQHLRLRVDLPDSPLPELNFILDTIVSCGQASLNPDVECVAGLDSPFRFDQDTEGTTIILNFRGTVVDHQSGPRGNVHASRRSSTRPSPG